MLSNAISSHTSFAPTYDRSGSFAHFHPEPVQPITAATGNSSTRPKNYHDKVTLSESGIKQSRPLKDTVTGNSRSAGTTVETQVKPDNRQHSESVQQLTVAEEKIVQQLKVRDQEVKIHEMAHVANAGRYARGCPTYSYRQGPDGRRYAIGGEVPIDISKEQTAEATLQKMQVVKRAAMAPAEPSSADHSIAAAAAALESQARQELQAEKIDTAQENAQFANNNKPTVKASSPTESTIDNVPLDQPAQLGQRLENVS